MKTQGLGQNRSLVCVLAIMAVIGGSLFILSLVRTSDLCSLARAQTLASERVPASPIQLRAILHYATSHVTPQQSFSEITVTLDVLKSLNHRPINFLVYGLGHDSLMWASLNAGGTTLFLEEDPKWVQTVLKDAPELHAQTVQYRTQLQQSDELLQTYKSVPRCLPARAMPLRGNEPCRLALHNLPDEVYDTEWDLIMIDAPRGYFAEAPGRMAAIYTSSVMARNRKGSGVTHVFLHDVDRKVEKIFAEEFLCRKNLVKGVGRLWHFEMPSMANHTRGGDDGAGFC